MLDFDKLDIKAPDEGLNISYSHDTILKFSLKCALQRHYWSSAKEDLSIFLDLFSGDKLLALWNSSPEHRSDIYYKFVIQKIFPRQLSSIELTKLKDSLATIAKRIYSEVEGKTDQSSATIARQLCDAQYFCDNTNVLSVLESLEDRQRSGDFLYWFDRFLEKERTAEEYEKVYFSLKRFPGSTELKKKIIHNAVNRDALSLKILEKIAKSSPISLKRKVVLGFSYELKRLNAYSYYKRNSLRYSVPGINSVEEAENKIDELEEKLILFAPVVDMRIQEALMDSLSKEKLVWLVPAVSALSNSWLSDKLNRRME